MIGASASAVEVGFGAESIGDVLNFEQTRSGAVHNGKYVKAQRQLISLHAAVVVGGKAYVHPLFAIYSQCGGVAVILAACFDFKKH